MRKIPLKIKDGLVFHLGIIIRKWKRIRRSFSDNVDYRSII